jgi:hypothetical protein
VAQVLGMGEISADTEPRESKSVLLGQVVLSRGARTTLAPGELLDALNRHERGDLGDISESTDNDRRADARERVRSVHATTNGTVFWIVTETSRAVTTVLLRDEVPNIELGGTARSIRLPKAIDTSTLLRLVTVELIPQALPTSAQVSGPLDAAEIVRARIGARDREHFVVLHLSTRHRLQSLEVVSVGSLTDASVHPREVFKAAILSNAAAIICAHNHPSGELTPSRADHLIMQRLSASAELLGIDLLDFLIVSPTGSRSLREELRALNHRT